MSLSDKIVMAEDHYYEGIGWCVRTEDVKEFIKELKEEMKEIIVLNQEMKVKYCDEIIFDTIDKLSGDKLC